MPLALPVPWMATAPLAVADTVAPPPINTPFSWAPEPVAVPLRETPPAPAITWEPPAILTPLLSLPEPLPPVPVMVTAPWPVAFTEALLSRETPKLEEVALTPLPPLPLRLSAPSAVLTVLRLTKTP